MRNHTTHTKSKRHPIQAPLCPPPVTLVSHSSEREWRTERPETHLGLLDTAVAARKPDDNEVAGHADRPADDAADECREEEKPRRGGGPVVWGLRHDLGDGVERDDAGCAAEGEDDACDDHVGEGEEHEGPAEVLPIACSVFRVEDPGLRGWRKVRFG